MLFDACTERASVHISGLLCERELGSRIFHLRRDTGLKSIFSILQYMREREREREGLYREIERERVREREPEKGEK